jgi:hypothetical protein
MVTEWATGLGMESPETMSIQRRPAARQIQPTGFSGRLEAIIAPTMGKARKGKKINTSPTVVPAASPWTKRARTYSATPTRNMATDRPASDQASQAAARRLIPPPP